MRQQMFDRDIFLAVGGEVRKELRHLVRESQLPALDENHDARRRRERLGERRHVEQRVGRHRLDLRLDRAIAVRVLEHDALAPADQHDAAGQITALDRARDRLFDPAFNRRIHAGLVPRNAFAPRLACLSHGRSPDDRNRNDREQNALRQAAMQQMTFHRLPYPKNQEVPIERCRLL